MTLVSCKFFKGNYLHGPFMLLLSHATQHQKSNKNHGSYKYMESYTCLSEKLLPGISIALTLTVPVTEIDALQHFETGQ